MCTIYIHIYIYRERDTCAYAYTCVCNIYIYIYRERDIDIRIYKQVLRLVDVDKPADLGKPGAHARQASTQTAS